MGMEQFFGVMDCLDCMDDVIIVGIICLLVGNVMGALLKHLCDKLGKP